MAETNIGAKLYIAVDSSGDPDPQNTDLAGSEFAALTWQEVPKVGNIGDTGVSQNMVDFPTWGDNLVTRKKGQATGNDAEILVLDETSTGLTALKSAASITDKNDYALKIEWSDGSIEYNRGPIGAPSYPKGGPEEFRTASFPVTFNQEPVFA